MTLIVLFVILAAALASAERSADRSGFAVAATFAVVSGLLLILGDLERALLLAAISISATGAASRVKYHHSGIKLTADDFVLAFAGTLPFLVKQYRRTAALVGLGAVVVGVAAVATLLFVEGPMLSLSARSLACVLAVGACALSYRLGGGAEGFRMSRKQRCCFFSTFFASLLDVRAWGPFGGLRLTDLAGEALPLLPARPARHATAPDIIIVQHESTFDPRLFGLPVEASMASFFSPPDSVSGSLNVDIFGGGSWQSEFSVLTGLSSASFGSDAYFMLRKGIGRFRHTLATSLAALGYEAMLISSCRRSFLNYDAFYRSMGFSERIFTDDLPPPFDVDAFEAANSDALFAKAVVDTYIAQVSADPSPRLVFALTNFNHGPHDRPLIGAATRALGDGIEAAGIADPEYAEYYRRLALTVTAWQEAKQRLLAHFPHRPMLIVQYGDHQPVLTRRLAQRLALPDDDRRHFQTFFSIEALNFPMQRTALPASGVLDIAFLGTIAQQAAGLPLDEVAATRASLIDACGEGYFASNSARKRQFHRALIDLGLIDLASVVKPSRAHPPAPVARRADARKA